MACDMAFHCAQQIPPHLRNKPFKIDPVCIAYLRSKMEQVVGTQDYPHHIAADSPSPNKAERICRISFTCSDEQKAAWEASHA